MGVDGEGTCIEGFLDRSRHICFLYQERSKCEDGLRRDLCTVSGGYLFGYLGSFYDNPISGY